MAGTAGVPSCASAKPPPSHQLIQPSAITKTRALRTTTTIPNYSATALVFCREAFSDISYLATIAIPLHLRHWLDNFAAQRAHPEDHLQKNAEARRQIE